MEVRVEIKKQNIKPKTKKKRKKKRKEKKRKGKERKKIDLPYYYTSLMESISTQQE